VELTTAYSLDVLVWNLCQTFATVSIEFWLIFEPQICPTRLAISFLLITSWAKRKVRSCVKLFDFFRGWIFICLTWNLSCFAQNSAEILTWITLKTISGEFFRNFLAYKLKLVKFRPTFCNFYSASVLRWKKITQVLSYVIWTHVRRHVHKRITKRMYRKEKLGRFVFGKPILFTLGLGLTTLYSLGVLVWNLYQTFVTVFI